MKRVYKRVRVAPVEGGHAVMLDGRQARGPGQRLLVLPGAAQARAVAQEWRAQTDEVRPETMPLTRLAATAAGLAGGGRERLVDEVAAYAATDLVCHRAEAPVSGL